MSVIKNCGQDTGREVECQAARRFHGATPPVCSNEIFVAGSLRVIAFLLRLFLAVVFAIELTSKRRGPLLEVIFKMKRVQVRSRVFRRKALGELHAK